MYFFYAVLQFNMVFQPGGRFEELSKLQDLFFSVLFETQHARKLSYYWDTKTLSMRNRIKRNKILFFHHLLSLPPSSILFQVLQEQIRLQLPCLFSEIEEFLLRNDFNEVQIFSKQQWRFLVYDAISSENEEELRRDMKNSSKICSY